MAWKNILPPQSTPTPADIQIAVAVVMPFTSCIPVLPAPFLQHCHDSTAELTPNHRCSEEANTCACERLERAGTYHSGLLLKCEKHPNSEDHTGMRKSLTEFKRQAAG
eukprot:TRINITY_DN2322_c0_g1_i1.p3 TRINITY_DN2322_c0_g1~~TRINITY_DN2322_c0_g1_i1.p3  ORF type:complete len:108 (+),score=25.21 TRINITY_DN2322_c0_g1_i1:601-924(+)